MNRRHFLGATALAAFQDSALTRAQAADDAVRGRSAYEVARDEDFWFQVRHAFTIDRNVINLNNGGVAPAPRVVMDTEIRYLEMENMTPTYYMWRILDPGVEVARQRLADVFGCDPEEIAITRNASESLEAIQFGMNLQRGDEVISTNQDYPRMITSWQQRELRDGIVFRQIKFQVPAPSLNYLKEQIEAAITPRTRVIHICHVTNRTGQLFPVRDICRMARTRNIEVIVDGAHSFAQFPFTRDSLECDYFGTSLHKWMLAPIGTGMLYVRKEKIPSIWPMFGADNALRNDIRKFEQIGTHPASQRNAITEAVTFHESIGGERKQERFRYLRKRWADRLRPLPNIEILHPADPMEGAGIGFVNLKGTESGKLVSWLWTKHRIWTTSFPTPGEYDGLRITPNVYTTVGEIDTFAKAMEQAATKGLV